MTSEYTISGTTIASGSSFQAPGLTRANVLARVADLLGWDSTDSTSKSKIYEAVSMVAEAACKHMRWWFLKSSGTFTTTADTAGYNLLTTNSSAMEDFDSVLGVWYRNSSTSRDPLEEITFETYMNRSQTQTSSSKPTAYAIYGSSYIYLHPTPDTSSMTIDVFYIRKHGKITDDSTDADLIIPGEFHRQIYVDCAAWALRHETSDPYSLMQCPQFAEALKIMATRQPDASDYRAEAGRSTPAGTWGWQDKRTPDGELIVTPTAI